MELWIRSQDKQTLSKANNLWIMNNQIWLEVPFYEHHKKIGLSVTGHNHKIATYKTKKRAIEVLDEIQKLLMPKMIYHTNNVEFIPSYQATAGGKLVSKNDDSKMEYMNIPIVYSMPKE